MSNQAQWFKSMVKGIVNVAVQRLLFDVSVHHDQETYNSLKQILNNLLVMTSSTEQISANLRQFYFQDRNDDDDGDDGDGDDGDGDDDDDGES